MRKSYLNYLIKNETLIKAEDIFSKNESDLKVFL